MVCPGETLPASAKVIGMFTFPGLGSIEKFTVKTVGAGEPELGVKKRRLTLKKFVASAFVPTGDARIVTPRLILEHSGNGSGRVGAVNTTVARPSLAVVTSVEERRPQFDRAPPIAVSRCTRRFASGAPVESLASMIKSDCWPLSSKVSGLAVRSRLVAKSDGPASPGTAD